MEYITFVNGVILFLGYNRFAFFLEQLFFFRDCMHWLRNQLFGI